MKDIGEVLRKTREAKGLSLEDVQAATKIRRRYLEALERGEETHSPGDVYFRGFLKTYANYLGLDGVAMSAEYRRLKEAQGAVGGETETAQTRADGSERTAPATRSVEKLRRPAAALIVAVLAFAYFALSGGGRVNAPPATPAQSPSGQPAGEGDRQGGGLPAGEGQQNKGLPQATPTSEPRPATTVDRVDKSRYLTVFSCKAESLSIEVQLIGEACWVRVDSDGKLVYEGHLERGKKYSWTAGETLLMRAGAPWAISVRVNGVDLGAGGEVGPAKDLEFRRIR